MLRPTEINIQNQTWKLVVQMSAKHCMYEFVSLGPYIYRAFLFDLQESRFLRYGSQLQRLWSSSLRHHLFPTYWPEAEKKRRPDPTLACPKSVTEEWRNNMYRKNLSQGFGIATTDWPPGTMGDIKRRPNIASSTVPPTWRTTVTSQTNMRFALALVAAIVGFAAASPLEVSS